MISKRYLLVFFTVASVIALLVAGSAYAVVEDAYVVGDVTVTPAGGASGACPGGTVTFSGSGLTPGPVLLLMGIDQGSESYAALIGTTTADATGNWSLMTTIPTQAEKLSDGAVVSLFPGVWDVAASDSELNVEVGTLTVLDCTVGATSLPKTGFPVAAAGLAGAGLFASAGVGVHMLRRRKK